MPNQLSNLGKTIYSNIMHIIWKVCKKVLNVADKIAFLLLITRIH